MEIILSEEKLAENASGLFEGATSAKKQADAVAVFRNDGQSPITFDVVLNNGTVEVKDASIPVGGHAVVQSGGEINYMSDFEDLYEEPKATLSEGMEEHANESLMRAGIDAISAGSLTKLSADPKVRVDKYITLPKDENGASIDFIIMKPWGEGGALIPQTAKSGDVLVQNGENGSYYFNNAEGGTLGNFVNAETGKPIPEELNSMKSGSLELLRQSVGATEPAVNRAKLPGMKNG